MFKMWLGPIFEKHIFQLKMPEIFRNNRFLAFPPDFIISFYWFFVQKCVIAMAKIWPSPIFKKNFFPAENTGNRRFCTFSLDFFCIFLVFFTWNIVNSNSQYFVKIAGTADFRRKNGISWISQAVLNIFSWNLAHWCKMIISKMWRRPIFEKHIFQVENAGNMPEKPVYRVDNKNMVRQKYVLLTGQLLP